MSYCSLAQCPRGSQVTIDRMDIEPDIIIRMTELGITGECPLRIVNNQSGCPLIVECRKTQIAIHRKIADKLIVKAW